MSRRHAFWYQSSESTVDEQGDSRRVHRSSPRIHGPKYCGKCRAASGSRIDKIDPNQNSPRYLVSIRGNQRLGASLRRLGVNTVPIAS
jgi:hypothetical protein